MENVPSPFQAEPRQVEARRGVVFSTHIGMAGSGCGMSAAILFFPRGILRVLVLAWVG